MRPLDIDKYLYSNLRIEIMKYLLNAGANVNAKNRDGRTILMYSIDNNNFEFFKTLLDYGSDVNMRDNVGNTALMIAVTYKNEEIEEGSLGGDMMFSILRDADIFLKKLLDHHSNVNAQNKRGETALMWAARSDNMDAIKILLEAGADVNIEDINGEIASTWAIMYHNTKICNILLHHVSSE